MSDINMATVSIELPLLIEQYINVSAYFSFSAIEVDVLRLLK